MDNLGLGAKARGLPTLLLLCALLVPSLARAAEPIKVGMTMALTGGVAPIGKQVLAALSIWRDDVNAKGGLLGRPVELVIADDESSPAVARQKTSKMVQDDNIDVHVGGFLSNICLACMPVWEDAKIVNMISVCLDTTLTTSKCNR